MFKANQKAQYEPITSGANAEQSENTANTESVEINIDGASNVSSSVSQEGQEAQPSQPEGNPEHSEKSMTLNVKGTDDKTHQIKIAEDASVTDLKMKLAAITEFAVDRQRLIFLGRMLSDSMKLADYKIKDGNFVHLVPKPSSANNNSSADDSDVSPRGDGRFMLPTDLGLFRDEESWRRNYYDDMQMLELGLWRARVRLLSSLMLFYYFLEFMTGLSFWMHPEEANNRYVPGHHPSNLYFALDSAENVAGMVVAMWGLKCAAEDSTLLSKRFLRAMWELATLHFVNLGIWTHQLATGQIKLQPRMDHPSGQDRVQGELGVSIVFSIMINLMIWGTCLSVASKFHKGLVAIEEQSEGTNEPATRTNEQRVTQV